MGRKKKRLLLARINNKVIEEVSVTSEVVKQEPAPVEAVIAEVEVEVPSVITEAPEAVKPPEKLIKLAKKK